MSLILVTRTSRSDSDFERSNVSLIENKPDGVNPNTTNIDYHVQKNEGKMVWFPDKVNLLCKFETKTMVCSKMETLYSTHVSSRN